MSSLSVYSIEQRPLVALAAPPNALGLSLLEDLLANFCRVKIFCEDKRGWQDFLEGLSSAEAIEISTSLHPENDGLFSYAICLEKVSENLDRFIQAFKEQSVKTLFVFPLSSESREEQIFFQEASERIKGIGPDFGLVFVGDIIGPRMKEEGFFARNIFTAFYRNTVELPEKDFYLHPVLAGVTAKKIVRMLFSFGPPGGEAAIISNPILYSQFCRRLAKMTLGLKIERVSPKKKFARYDTKVEKRIYLETDLEEAVRQTFHWLASLKSKPKAPRAAAAKKPSFALKRFSMGFLLVFLVLAAIPFLATFLSIGSLFLGKNFLVRGNLDISKRILGLSYKTSSASGNQFSLLSEIPLVGAAFVPLYKTSALVRAVSDIGIEAAQLVALSQVFATKILGDEVYDPPFYSEKISLGLSSLYTKLGFLEGELGPYRDFKNTMVDKFLGEGDLSSIREKIFYIKNISGKLPGILGKEKPTAYLVLFQNNMELRPTGGFIGSFAIVSFDSGRLSDFEVSDVYSADGQLKGHVTPPEPIREHLGEANWYLRDSNWDPDFPTSAARAEWFLDKEIDKKVDGVLAIDLEVVKSLLKVLGPVSLTDYNLLITNENLYQKTQEEVHRDFFPGSYKKDSFLTSLSRQLLAKILSITSDKFWQTALEVSRGLEEKHVQLFFNDPKVQKSISELGYDGTVLTPTCLGNCKADFVGLVEANVGVNKTNYFVKRQAFFEAVFAEQGIRKNLLINFKNEAPAALGQEGRYKVYLRLILPQDAEFLLASTAGTSDLEEEDVTEIQGRKEIGVLVEVNPQDTKTVSFSWKSGPLDFSRPGEYSLFWRKQAGTSKDPVSIKLTFPAASRPVLPKEFSLTQDRSYLYNTELARDLFARIYW